MFDMRRREEALGERRMMGSGRRVGFLGLLVRCGGGGHARTSGAGTGEEGFGSFADVGEVGGLDAAEDTVTVAHAAFAVVNFLQAGVDLFARAGAGGAARDG